MLNFYNDLIIGLCTDANKTMLFVITLYTSNASQGNAGKCRQRPQRKNTNLEIPHISHCTQNEGSKSKSNDHPNGYGCAGKDASFIEIRQL
jgi:hypothetical protein